MIDEVGRRLRAGAPVIEISHASWTNLGDVLMANSLIQNLSGILGEHHIALPSRRKHRSDGGKLWHVTLLRGENANRTWLKNEIVRRAQTIYPTRTTCDCTASTRMGTYVSPASLKASFSLSGYRWGDFWGAQLASDAQRIEQLRRRGVPTILLPKTFGPFRSYGMRDLQDLERLIRSSSLVFARDQLSLEMLVDAIGDHGNVVIAPDYTMSVAPTFPPGFERYAGRMAIIPNVRIIQRYGSEVFRDVYSVVYKWALRCELRPYFLYHSRRTDRRVVREVFPEFEQADHVVPDSSTDAKGYISIASVVFSGRFHGLASALHQGVPAVGIGWAHKYREIMREYGIADLLVDSHDIEDGNLSVRATLESKLNHALLARGEFRERLVANQAGVKRRSDQMWLAIREVLIA